MIDLDWRPPLHRLLKSLEAQSDFRTNLSHNHHQQVFLRGVKSIYQNKLALQGAAIIFGFTKGIFLLQRLWIPSDSLSRWYNIFANMNISQRIAK